jgi:DNA-directed RNA polymerase subunit RPC12/RpoP
MKKAIILFLVLAVAGLAFVSCYIEHDDVTYCFECGSKKIKADGKEGIYTYYKCKDCGSRFAVYNPYP